MFFGCPNRCTTDVTFSGGAWSASFPLANLGNQAFDVVARSSTDATADTKIRMDLGSTRVLKAIALAAHNLSGAATWRVLLGTTSGGSDVYSGTLATWIDSTFEASLSTTGMEDADAFENALALIVLPAFTGARHVTIEISDTTNPDGYVQIGRVFVGGGFVPTINAAYGLQDGWLDLSTTERSESGAPWPVERRRLKQARMVLEGLTLTEGDTVHELQRQVGTTGEVLFLPSLTDLGYSQRYGFLGTMEEMSALEYPYFRRRKAPVVLTEKA